MKRVQVFGTGCPKCKKLTEETQAAVKALGLDCSVEKVTDIIEIAAYGILMIPALVVDGVVKVVGRVPSVDELKKMLSE